MFRGLGFRVLGLRGITLQLELEQWAYSRRGSRKTDHTWSQLGFHKRTQQ